MTILSPPEIFELHKYFSLLANNLKVIIYVRNPFTHISSCLQERVKNGNQTLEDFNNSPKVMNFEFLIKSWEKVFGEENVIIRKFECEDIITDFFSIFNIDISSSMKFEKVTNSSLSLEAVLVANELAKLLPSKKRTWPMQRLINKYLHAIDGGKFSLKADSKTEVWNKLSSDVLYLNNRLGFDYKPNQQTNSYVHTKSLGSYRAKADEIIRELMKKWPNLPV